MHRKKIYSYVRNLIDIIRQHAGDAIVNNPVIPNSQNETVVSEVGNSIINGLKDLISKGKGQDVANLLQNEGGNIASNPAVQRISSGFVQSLVSKFGLGHGRPAGSQAAFYQMCFQSLVHKTCDPNDSSFSMEGIISHLTGGPSR